MNRWFWFCALLVLLTRSCSDSREPVLLSARTYSSAHEQFILLMCSCFCICADDTAHTCVMYAEEETQRCITHALRFYRSEFLLICRKKFWFCLFMPRWFFQRAGHYVHVYIRRKTRLIESNAKCRYLNNWLGKGLCCRCFTFLRPPSLLWPHIPPTHCMRVHCTQCTYSHGEGGGGANQREGWSKIPTWLTVSLVYKLY